MPVYRSIRDLDWTLLIVTLALCALGVLQIYSATLATKWQDAWWKQTVWVVSGLAMMWMASNVDYHMLLGRVTYLYLGSVALLITTAVAGNKVFGSTRWIRVAGFTLQTSEFVKIVLILLVALPNGSQNGRLGELERPCQAGRTGRPAHVAGNEAAGPWDLSDLYPDIRRGRVYGRFTLEIHRRDCHGPISQFADRLSFS